MPPFSGQTTSRGAPYFYVMPHEMTSSLVFNSIDGSLHIKGYPTTIQSGLDRDLAASAFSKFYRTAIDHKNGYEWLAFQGVNFGGYPCGFSLGFHLRKLEQIHWSVTHSKCRNGRRVAYPRGH